MLYSYNILKGSEVVINGQNLLKDSKGFHEEYAAQQHAEEIMRIKKYDPKDYTIDIVPIPENIEESDILEGHFYPGHEMWDDDDSPDK